ncbi:hypothetical protein EDD85DRAFT_1004593 [Armillaria nabsnona]|nr:hypothetical protein EDD85DRAFT_1004593 [Armillaria nabsnona]
MFLPLPPPCIFLYLSSISLTLFKDLQVPSHLLTTTTGQDQEQISDKIGPTRQLEHIPRFRRPMKEIGDKAYRISPMLHRGLGMFAACQSKTGDLVADERLLMGFPIGPPTDFDLATAKVPGENRIKLTLKSSDDILSSIFECMSEESQEAFMGLQNSHLTNQYGLEYGLKDKTDNKTVPPTSAASSTCPRSLCNFAQPGTFGQLQIGQKASRLMVSSSPVVLVPILLTLGGGARDAAVQMLARIEEGLQASDAYHETLDQLFNAYANAQDEKNVLIYGEKLWQANLVAGEPLYEMFRSVEVMKKMPQWMTGGFEVMPECLVSLFNAS